MYVGATNGGSSSQYEEYKYRYQIILRPEVPLNEKWNEARIRVLRLFGYTGPIHYDSSGLVIQMTNEEIRKYQESLQK